MYPLILLCDDEQYENNYKWYNNYNLVTNVII